MKLHKLHGWSVTPRDAIALQSELACQVIADLPLMLDRVRLVAGVDVSVKSDPATGQDMSRAAVVILSYPELEIVEVARAAMPTPFPYIPGLLSFREGPVLLQAFEAIQHTPDVLLFDGMGRAHPRRIGIASHMGLWLDLPTVGCGKTHLLGQFAPVAPEAGSYSLLFDDDEIIGAVLRTRAHVKPVYISAGHRIDLESALALTMRCTTRYRLPEPIRAAHHAAGEHFLD
ncbi:MAG: deoxyribonuclease V [Anaerolineae bacterium]|nr:deoxyribonuclease V [Anaerolineae bacterium]